MNAQQHPLESGYGAASTADEVIRGVDLSGKTAIVTGGYSGLGRETVRVLRGAGARVIVPARDTNRAREALRRIEGVEIWSTDLLDSRSIAAFAARFLNENAALHILVNSAGIMALPERELDARGYELQFATNHLGHFELTTRLLPALRAAKGARVVSVSSLGHRYSPVHFDDINFEHREYGPWLAYGQSKTANILFAIELDAREKANGIRAFSLHPGSIAGTGLEKHIPTKMLIDAGVLDAEGNPIRDPSRNLKTIEQGAATSVWCATSAQLDGLGGLYCENCDVAVAIEPAGGKSSIAEGVRPTGGVRSFALDQVAASRLWALSETMISAATNAQE
ncbi:SDR family NAD(P)-dependent oxidoreductase [Mesorhizobium sp. BR1-1-16]|nr:oxidoreductase [Mesorhizobium sp. BR1-1-16]MBZ9935549.1 SDR family NAD(P)-dependent oxidoreductase [Mesorhizobium sp. BR1-1-16]